MILLLSQELPDLWTSERHNLEIFTKRRQLQEKAHIGEQSLTRQFRKTTVAW